MSLSASRTAMDLWILAFGIIASVVYLTIPFFTDLTFYELLTKWRSVKVPQKKDKKKEKRKEKKGRKMGKKREKKKERKREKRERKREKKRIRKREKEEEGGSKPANHRAEPPIPNTDPCLPPADPKNKSPGPKANNSKPDEEITFSAQASQPQTKTSLELAPEKCELGKTDSVEEKDKGNTSVKLKDILAGLRRLTLSEEDVLSMAAILKQKSPCSPDAGHKDLKEDREKACVGDQQGAIKRELNLIKAKAQRNYEELQSMRMEFKQIREMVESQLALQLENKRLRDTQQQLQKKSKPQ